MEIITIILVTLLTEDNVKLSKQFSDGFKRSVYLNKYKMIPVNKKEPNNGTSHIKELFDANYQGVKKFLWW